MAKDIAGSVRCTTLRSAPPLSLMPQPGGVYVVGGAAGPVGGDEISLRVEVGRGATFTVRGTAATLVFPGPAPVPSHAAVEVDLEEGAFLRWLPEPTILVDGCDHRAVTRIRLGEGSSLVWREEVVLGRHGEAGGSLLSRLLVDIAQRPLLRTDLAVGPRWAGSAGPAGLNGARAMGSVLAVGESRHTLTHAGGGGGGDVQDLQDVRIASMELEGRRGVLVTAVSTHAGALRAALDAVVASALDNSPGSMAPCGPGPGHGGQRTAAGRRTSGHAPGSDPGGDGRSPAVDQAPWE